MLSSQTELRGSPDFKTICLYSFHFLFGAQLFKKEARIVVILLVIWFTFVGNFCGKIFLCRKDVLLSLVQSLIWIFDSVPLPCWLPTKACSQLLEAALTLCHLATSISKSAIVCGILFLLWISPISPAGKRKLSASKGSWDRSPRSHWQLPFSWPAPRTSRVLCGASGARNNSRVKSHFRTEQSYLCPARFQMRCKNKVWTDGRICLFHVPLVNLVSSFARGMFVFHTWTFFPRYKIQYLKVGSGKVDQVILRLIPQMCLFIHVWNTFFPQITGHIKS